MRKGIPLILLFLLFVVPFTSCEKDQEADKVTVAGGPGSGGTGGGGGGGGGSNSGLIDPNSIDINSEPIFSCDGNGTDYVVYDSTSLHQQLFSTSPQTVTASQFVNFSGIPYTVQIQMYGMSIAGADATQAEMDGFFTPGSRDYSGVSLNPGVMISIVEEASDMATWYQTNLNAQPGSSYFTITDAQGWMDGSVYKVKVRAIFQCSMWSVSGSNSMDCVDGIFVGDFTSDAI